MEEKNIAYEPIDVPDIETQAAEARDAGELQSDLVGADVISPGADPMPSGADPMPSGADLMPSGADARASGQIRSDHVDADLMPSGADPMPSGADAGTAGEGTADAAAAENAVPQDAVGGNAVTQEATDVNAVTQDEAVILSAREDFRNEADGQTRTEGVRQPGGNTAVDAANAQRDGNKTAAGVRDTTGQHSAGQQQVEVRPARDRMAEWTELVAVHPEVVGQKLPDDVFRACATSERSVLQTYESMMLNKLGEELTRLRAENATLRQNADNAARSPVTGTAVGGGGYAEPEDPFLKAFDSYR